MNIHLILCKLGFHLWCNKTLPTAYCVICHKLTFRDQQLKKKKKSSLKKKTIIETHEIAI